MSDHVNPPIRLFFCGDVVTGRGIDQILPCPSQPVLHESSMRDARRYVDLAEHAHGAIPRAVAMDYIWGDALAVLDGAATDVRIINLETSITLSDEYWRGKGINYRMHPRNVGCLAAARIDCCVLANNHVLDWGYDGLSDTLRALDEAGIAHAGAGGNASQAAAPAVLVVQGKGRVLVFAYGVPTSGIPPEWAATRERPGINLLVDLTEENAQRLAREMTAYVCPGDVMVASIHWGDNWGYHLSDEEQRFARRLIDKGVHVVHGHSSHHVRTVEIRDGHLILYGCGDFLNDYEGIGGHERFRGDLVLIYLAAIEPRLGRLVELHMLPLQLRRFRLNRAAAADVKWLGALLNRLGAPAGTRVDPAGSNILAARPAGAAPGFC